MTLGHPNPGFRDATASATLSAEEFKRVAGLALREAGLTIPESKIGMIQSRLARRLAATGCRDFTGYLDLLDGPDGKNEIQNAISTLTTNVSHFFREAHHFKTLREAILPSLIDRARSGGRVRLWTAGCSSGQEPYSIAMEILSFAPDAGRYDIRVLATDIDFDVLRQARTGQYERRLLEGVPANMLDRYFKPATQDGSDLWQIKKPAQDLISFKQLNLIGKWPMTVKFDVIFCRNVVIYFSEETQIALWPRFRDALAPAGWIFLGHSERMHNDTSLGFVSGGVTTYRRS